MPALLALTRDELESSENAELRKLLELWEHVRGPRAMPRRHDLGIEPLAPWFGHIAIVKVLKKEAPRFLVTLVGTKITQYTGADITGEFLENAIPEYARTVMLQPVEQCIVTRRPVVTRLEPGILRGAFKHLDRIHLPCGDDGECVNTIVVGMYVESVDIMRGTIFERGGASNYR